MLIQDLRQIRPLFESLPGTFIGVGMTAFSRILPSYFLDAFRIVALHRTLDLPILRQKAEIFCLREETEGDGHMQAINAEHLLLHPQTRRYLDAIPEPKYFFPYQDYPGLRSAASAKGWRMLANSPSLRLKLVRREFFKKMAEALNLPQAPGGIYPIGVIHENTYEKWCRLLGEQMVIQLPDIEQGGGRGTFFVRSATDYRTLRERLKENRWRNRRLETVSVHKFLEGTPSSVAVCVTRHGTLVSSLQQQLLDLPYCRDFAESGVFCGHVWHNRGWPRAINESAFKQACRIGNYLGSLGYKGILGIDFVVQEREGDVYPMEINPRLTGAFPMLSLLHLQKGVIPLEAFHMLEFLEIPYRIDRDQLNQCYAGTVNGSHLLLFRPMKLDKTGSGALRPGLYEQGPAKGDFRFMAATLEYRDIKNENQFILADGPMVGEPLVANGDASHARLCRLLFAGPVADLNGKLSSQALSAADWVLRKTAKEEIS